MSKLPCVCNAGEHNFSVYEMANIIQAFQRGELTVMTERGIAVKCLLCADKPSPVTDNGPCGVLLGSGRICQKNRGHRSGGHK